MKRILLILAALVLLVSGWFAIKKPIERTLNPVPEIASTGENEYKSVELQNDFLPILKGVWVVSDYIEDIEKTNSPFRSSDKLNDIVCLVIDDKVEGDSLDIGASLNNHEGMSFAVYFRPGQKYNSLPTGLKDYENKKNRFELGYKIEKRDTVLYLYHYSNKNKLLGKRKFSKISQSQSENDMGEGIQKAVNKKLFTGSYTLLDENKNNLGNVNLKTDGTLEGFPGYKTYHIATDFVVRALNNLDQIYFDVYTDNQKDFAYKIKGDTISIYEAIEDEKQSLLVQGPLKYKLIRQ